MAGEAEVTGFRNPSDRYILTLEASVAGLCILISVVLTISTGKLLGMILPGMLGVLMLPWVYYIEVWHRPETVKVGEQGVTLLFRNTKTKEVAWSSMRGVYSHPGPSWTRSGRGIGRGGFRVKGERMPYPITYEASVAIIRAYTKAIGRPPESWDGASN